MTVHQFVEDAPLVGVHVTADNYMACSVRCARTGVQQYAGREFGMADRDVINVYRPESEVFSADSLRTFAHRPVTNDHPPEPVTAENWKRFSVGTVGDEVTRDGQFVRVPMLLMDKAAVDAVQGGKREISMGYTSSLSFEDGVTPEGEPYQAVMRDLKINHLAIVERGRAGPEARIGDAAPSTTWGASPINDGTPSSPGVIPTSTTTTTGTDMQTITKVVDGISVDTTPQGGEMIDRLQKQLSDAITAATTDATDAADEAERLQAAHDAAMAVKDGEAAAKDAKIAELEAKAVTGAALDALVADRAVLTTKARAFAKDADFAGKSDHEVKSAAVAAARGPQFAADKSEAYIAVAFDMLDEPKDGKTGDPVRDAMIGRAPVADASVDDHGYSDYVAEMNGAITQGSAK